MSYFPQCQSLVYCQFEHQYDDDAPESLSNTAGRGGPHNGTSGIIRSPPCPCWGIASGWCCSGGQVLAQRRSHIARSTLETKTMTLSASLCLLVSCLPTTDPSELRSFFLDSTYPLMGSKQ